MVRFDHEKLMAHAEAAFGNRLAKVINRSRIPGVLVFISDEIFQTHVREALHHRKRFQGASVSVSKLLEENAEHDGYIQIQGPKSPIFFKIGSRKDVLYHFRDLGWFTPDGLGDF